MTAPAGTSASTSSVAWPEYLETRQPSPVAAFLREIRRALVDCDRDPYFAEHVTVSNAPCWHLLILDDPDAPNLHVAVLLNTHPGRDMIGVRVRAYTAQEWETGADPREDLTLAGWPGAILAERTRAAVARLLGRKQL